MKILRNHLRPSRVRTAGRYILVAHTGNQDHILEVELTEADVERLAMAYSIDRWTIDQAIGPLVDPGPVLYKPADRAEALANRIGELAAEIKPGHLDECGDQLERDLYWRLSSLIGDLRSAERNAQIVAEMHREREG